MQTPLALSNVSRQMFLKRLTTFGAVASVSNPLTLLANTLKSVPAPFQPTCVVVPTETAGPFPLNLSNDMAYYRRVINEDKQGATMNVNMTFVNVNDACSPIVGARIDFWHCDKDGYYSGFTTNAHLGSQNHVGETFCRGIQISDANGQVTFTSIFPGWYPGRTGHVHFRVYLGGTLEATSQFTFPIAAKNAVYTTNSLYSIWGADPKDPQDDNIFNTPAGVWQTLQLVTMETDAATGEINCAITVGVDAPVQTICSSQPIITGNVSVCELGTNTYAVTPVTNATYLWTVTGGTIVSGQNNHTVTVQWDTGIAGSLNIQQVNP